MDTKQIVCSMDWSLLCYDTKEDPNVWDGPKILCFVNLSMCSQKIGEQLDTWLQTWGLQKSSDAWAIIAPQVTCSLLAFASTFVSMLFNCKRSTSPHDLLGWSVQWFKVLLKSFLLWDLCSALCSQNHVTRQRLYWIWNIPKILMWAFLYF